MADERRYKVLRIDPVLLVDWFNHSVMTTRLTVNPPLPPGTEVVSVHAEWERGTLALMLYNSAFAPVPFGEMPPEYRPLITDMGVLTNG